MPTPSPRSSATAVAALAAALRDRILDAELPSGSALREEALAQEYGVNRHTVRAALQSLAAARLVDFAAFKGARVREFADDDVLALMEYRIALEGEAVVILRGRTAASGSADAAGRPVVELPPSVLEANARLRSVCERSPDDHRAVELAHAELHHALVAAAGSARITEAHSGLEDELLLFLNQLRPVLPAAEIADQHDRLLAGIRSRGEGAIREHLEFSAAQLIALTGDGRLSPRRPPTSGRGTPPPRPAPRG